MPRWSPVMPQKMTAPLVTVLACTRNEDLSTIYLKAGSLQPQKKREFQLCCLLIMLLLKVSTEIDKSEK